MKKNIWVLLFSIMLLSLFAAQAQAQEENIAKYRVTTHSSSIDVNQCGHLVVDGDRGSYWEAKHNDKDQWILIDLGEVLQPYRIMIDWGANHAIRYEVRVMGELNSSESVVYQSEQGEGGQEMIELAEGAVFRYLKIKVIEVVEPIRGCTINEVEVWGEPQGRFIESSTFDISADELSLNGSHWRVQSAALVSEEPQEVAKSNYNDQLWIPATVPGTILGDYYNFGALPDPLFGENMHQISDSFFSGNDFWYRTTIVFPAEMEGKRLYINFAGVNYRSKIYFNGQYLGSIDGAFYRGEFEVTQAVSFDEPNTLAVLVEHNDNWVSGSFKVIKKSLGAQTTNGDMLGLDGPTSLASAGWNWLPIVKGRNNGIWNNVSVITRQDISIIDPWVTSKLNLPDTTRADLTIRATLKNSSDRLVTGLLKAQFDDITISQNILLEANSQKEVSLSVEEFKGLQIKNPKLWWPNGYGDQELKKLKLEFIEQGEVSDSTEIDFGIREFEYKIENKVLFVYCNGCRIQLKGGNWGLPEAMMRLDSEHYLLRVKLHKDANFNMIRNWIGMTNREEFYAACDKYGILIFDDFWLANPANGPAAQDLDLFMANAEDKIKWVRKHPSLVLYCGRNEGTPPLKFDNALRESVEKLDDSRYYVSNSADKPLSGFGPYDVRTPKWYFENRGATFHSEIGIIAIPEVESLRKMMPEENLWPINDMWAIHDYQDPRSQRYTAMLNERYGECESVEEYSTKAQLQNYETSKALFECMQSKQGSGMLLWMSQSAWPSLICQLYDHYLEYTSAYFAVKKACSQIHIFYDSALSEIRVANNTISDLEGLQARATVFDQNGNSKWQRTCNIDVAISSTQTAFAFDYDAVNQVQYLRLELLHNEELVGDNFYWLENNSGNCLDINDLEACDVEMTISSIYDSNECVAEVILKNNSSQISLLNKIKVKNRQTHESILPIIYSDNYISLLPGEERILILRFSAEGIAKDDIVFCLEGWNTQPKKS